MAGGAPAQGLARPQAPHRRYSIQLAWLAVLGLCCGPDPMLTLGSALNPWLRWLSFDLLPPWVLASGQGEWGGAGETQTPVTLEPQSSCCSHYPLGEWECVNNSFVPVALPWPTTPGLGPEAVSHNVGQLLGVSREGGGLQCYNLFHTCLTCRYEKVLVPRPRKMKLC